MRRTSKRPEKVGTEPVWPKTVIDAGGDVATAFVKPKVVAPPMPDYKNPRGVLEIHRVYALTNGLMARITGRIKAMAPYFIPQVSWQKAKVQDNGLIEWSPVTVGIEKQVEEFILSNLKKGEKE